MSNLSLATFLGVWDTLKWIFGIKIENLHVFALFWVYPKGDIDMEGQQAVLLLLPKTATDECVLVLLEHFKKGDFNKLVYLIFK